MTSNPNRITVAAPGFYPKISFRLVRLFKHCEYKAMLKKTDIEPMVIEAIREIVRNEEYAQAIKKRIGVQIDTKAVDKELEGYQAKLKEVDLNKTRLEREIDSLPADAKYRERKLHDMTLRLDSLYDVIVELEEKIEDARLRRDAIKQQAITLENIYKIMVNFDCVYNIINDEEKRNVVTALIKEIEIYRNDESEYPLKRIGLNFPVFKDGGEVTELLWDKGNTVESLQLMQGQTSGQVGGSISDPERGYQIRFALEAEDAVQDTADVTVTVMQGAKSESVKINSSVSQQDGGVVLSAALTGSDWQVGKAELTIRLSETEYDCCLPVSALHSDNGGDLVYSVEERNTILGLQNIVRKVYVEVVERNNELAALRNYTTGAPVVAATTKSLQEGARVRTAG